MVREELARLMSAAPGLAHVLETLETAGHTAHLVGGSVRDALMGRAVNDFDVATSARPEMVTVLFEAAGYSVHPTGLEHGTVTAVLDGEPYEITTWRRDVETDGRRAVVAFADRLEDDALRRDFTFNALYADRFGRVVDPTGQGLADADARRVRFVGQPGARIREDALRILRFYRFLAILGSEPEDGPDLAACEALKDLTAALSRERVGVELLKLLSAADWIASAGAMARSGLLADLLPGFPGASEACMRMKRLSLQERMQGLTPCPHRRLAVLVDQAPKSALKLSNKDTREIDLRIAAASSGMAPSELGYRYGAHVAEDALLRRFALGSDHAASGVDLVDVRRGAAQVFPLKAADLMDRYKGKALGDELKRREALWVSSDFQSAEAV